MKGFERHINRQQRRALRAQGKWEPLRRMTPVPLAPERLRELMIHAKKIRPDFSDERLAEAFEAAIP